MTCTLYRLDFFWQNFLCDLTTVSRSNKRNKILFLAILKDPKNNSDQRQKRRERKQISLPVVTSLLTNIDNFPFPILIWLNRRINFLKKECYQTEQNIWLKTMSWIFLLPSRLNILFAKRLLQTKMLLFIFYSIKIGLKFYSGRFHKRQMNQNPVDFESRVLFCIELKGCYVVSLYE